MESAAHGPDRVTIGKDVEATMAEEHEPESNFDDGRLVHAIHQDQHDRILNAIEAFSLASMRAPALASAGGIAAALGFFSANFSRYQDNLEVFDNILFWLFLALFLSVVAPGGAYLSQYAYSLSMTKEKQDWKYPYVHPTDLSKRYRRIGYVFHGCTIAVILASYCAIGWGGLIFLSLFE